ncbi:unnamed protein product [Arctia plantaginis]|uniref:Endonuclease/exonuclease/phosphatase domain-containing protein n=1 Tax=Arctia plantaginis TaxID=874455 RepID=A0A8S1ADM9_ARCPL|nr:unnamed protein product [Arctia plantaginis]
MDANCLVYTGGEVAIIAIYRSPSFDKLENFFISLNDTLNSLRAYKTIAVIGDININIISDRMDSEEYLNICFSHGLLPAHQIPTRDDACLDHDMLKTRRYVGMEYPCYRSSLHSVKPGHNQCHE